jgi:hypothetical protein
MLVPRRTITGLRAVSRCFSSTAVRPWATPTGRYSPNDPRGGNPVDDIDVLFDLSSEGQASHQKQRLEQSGLDLHSALPHHPKASAAGAAAAGMMGKGMPGAAKMGKEMGYMENSMYAPHPLWPPRLFD